MQQGRQLAGIWWLGATIELVILDLSDEWSFERKKDEETSYLELDPRPRREGKGRFNRE